MERIDGKTAFITGGSRGIGLGIARAFASEGARLALVDVDQSSLVSARAELGKLTAVETFVLDVRDRGAYARVADEVEARLGPVSILCNNAGVAGGIDVAHMTYELWDWVMGVNLNGVINGIQTFVPRMIERKSGAHIVNTASGAGLAAVGSGFLYTTSKFAVVGLSESLRTELEPFGIGVSVLCPGPVATDIVRNSVVSMAALPDQSRTQPTREEIALREQRVAFVTSFLAQGVPPDEVGRMVLSGIKDNRLHILTDRIMFEGITARTKALLAAMPSAT
jgi:NAD(P)-dependent dehydrogenase (short-subunit alcohol dehydrogenase family)